MDIKYLSRKFLLSALLAIIATVFIMLGVIEAYQWQWVIMATAVSYVAANAISKKTETEYSKEFKVKIKDRLASLFSREFIVCVGTVLVSSLLLHYNRIDSTVWFTVCSALAVAYNIGNSIGKS